MLKEEPVKSSLTAERLREVLSYDPATGIFRWLISRGSVRAGDLAGTDDGRGYLVIRIDGGKYLASRLAFLYVTGKWPALLVDHKDTDTSNNRWENLREATRQGNSANSRLPIHNSSGLKGASWHKRDRRWRATIGVNGRKIHIGSFGTPEAAHAAYLSAARHYYGDFAHASA